MKALNRNPLQNGNAQAPARKNDVTRRYTEPPHPQIAGQVIALFDNQAAERSRSVGIRRQPGIHRIERLRRREQTQHDATRDLDAPRRPHVAERREIAVVVRAIRSRRSPARKPPMTASSWSLLSPGSSSAARQASSLTSASGRAVSARRCAVRPDAVSSRPSSASRSAASACPVARQRGPQRPAQVRIERQPVGRRRGAVEHGTDLHREAIVDDGRRRHRPCPCQLCAGTGLRIHSAAQHDSSQRPRHSSRVGSGR